MKATVTALLTAIGALTWATSLATSMASHVVREKIAGMDVLIERTTVKDVIILNGLLPAGAIFNPPGNPLIADLVAGMLDDGTAKHDKFAIAKALEEVGARIGFGADTHLATFNARCLKEDLPLVLSLLAEELRFPAFSAGEFAKLKKQTEAGIQAELDDPDARAKERFVRAIYPQGHPNRQPTSAERLAALNAATVDDLKTFHAAHYGPAHMTLVVAGDVDVPVLRAQLQQHFAGWHGGSALPSAQPWMPTAASAVKVQTLFIADKTSVTVLWGQADGLRYRDADALALRVATTAFGSGFTGRLMHRVRDVEGLTYGIGVEVGGDSLVDGAWQISASFAPALLDKGIASTRRELMQWYESGITAEELERCKRQLIGSYNVGLATTGGLAGAILEAVHRGDGVSWLDEYPKRIAALTLEQVNGAIKRHLNPEQMVLIESGTIPGAGPS